MDCFLTSWNMPSETWGSVPGYEGLYEASDLGRVRSLDRDVIDKAGTRTRHFRGRILKLQFRKNTGYLMVALSKDGIVEDWYVHRLVLTTFCGSPKSGEEGCHGNDVRTDNRLENLRWDTHHANVGDAIQRGRFRSFQKSKQCLRGHDFVLIQTNRGPRQVCPECRRINERARYHQAKLVS